MERTWKPTTAGILNIITGAMGMSAGGIMLWLRQTLVSINWSELMDSWMMWPRMWGIGSLDLLMQTGIPTVILAAGIIALVFGIIALVGGIYAIKRRRWGLALAGAILSIPIQGVIGILAIIFVSLGKREFE